MAKYITTTRVYIVNGRLIVANDPIEAIGIYNDYYNKKVNGYIEEIKSLKVVSDESCICPSSSALIRQLKEVTKEELKAWIVKNVRKSNISDDSLAESLYSLLYE